jgi:hypothetical protein
MRCGNLASKWEGVRSARRRARGPSKAKLLLAGGVLGIVGAGFILAAPELGFASALGGTIAGIGSAGITLLARK